MNPSVDFIRGFSLRVASYFLQIFFPAYLVYYVRAYGVIYWALVVTFWVSAGLGMLLPYFFKRHIFYLEVLFLLASILMFITSRYLSVIILIILSAVISALTGTYAYFSYARASYSGVVKYMRGTGAGLLFSAIIAILIFYFGSLRIISFVGIALSTFSIILIITTLKRGPEKHEMGSLSIQRLFKTAVRSLSFSYSVTGNALSWISFTTYIYYYLYVGISAGYLAVLLLMLVSAAVIFIIRFLMKDKYQKKSKAFYFLLYALSFFLIFLSVIYKNFYLDVVSAVLIGISQGVLPAVLLYESINLSSNGSYDGYVIYNSFIGLGELISNIFFGVFVALSVVKLFYLMPFAVSIIVIFLEIKYRA
ncbi:MAG: hypothetical protein ACP5LF_03275 [Nitrososphaeria archaeon]|nr:hypothetical protein [Conexivisphaerales archaeon]